MAETKTRVISAVVLGVLALALYLYLGAMGITILAALALVLAVVEYERMIIKVYAANNLQRGLFYLMAFSFLFAGMAYHSLGLLYMPVALVTYACISIVSSRGDVQNKDLLQFLSMSFIGVMYVAVFPSFIFSVLKTIHAEKAFLLFILLTFASDIAAYFGGRRFGKNLLSQKLSPKKTIEGAVFGLLGSVAAALLAHFVYFSAHSTIFGILILAVACNIASQAGDLFESALKRSAGVKDSGSIMPGHGGVLDRIDGLIFSAPVFYVLFSAFYL